MDPQRHANLMEELNALTRTEEAKQLMGIEILRHLFLNHPNFMKLYNSKRWSTLPQALNSTYLGQLGVKYMDSVLELVRNYNDEEVLDQSIIRLANVHKHRGITVAHFIAVVPIFTDTLVSFFKNEANKESMQEILSKVLPKIGTRL
ncbi:hypothetical protein EG68_01361 [Paragonimus skrjabini miyazakii]|uniref:Globin domain-containing protein n=1 Tax=Paragonimus skrjabini miyazakii TaxID=59628 RepID=A0A8S9Z9C0_9TREM|nr:hypothetical protein EG68_01361 [Paragonimus skrjabini miyazakii]